MKKISFSGILFLILSFGTLSAQVELRIEAGGGVFHIKQNGDFHEPGYRFQGGLSAEGAIPYLRDLSWEIGVNAAYARADLYKRKFEEGPDGTMVSEGINGIFPVDRTVRYIHSFGFLDIPLRIRYQAFGFMGLSLGINFSYTLKDEIGGEDTFRAPSYHYDGKWISQLSGSLFFPLTNRLRLDITGYYPQARFYDSKFSKPAGGIEYDHPYMEYTVLAKISYRLVGNKARGVPGHSDLPDAKAPAVDE